LNEAHIYLLNAGWPGFRADICVIRLLPWYMIPRAKLFSVTLHVQEKETDVLLSLSGEHDVVVCVADVV
jgi:hypothetical protein